MNEQVAGHPQSITRKWQKSQKNSLAKKYKKLKGKNKNYFLSIPVPRIFQQQYKTGRKGQIPVQCFQQKNPS